MRGKGRVAGDPCPEQVRIGVGRIKHESPAARLADENAPRGVGAASQFDRGDEFGLKEALKGRRPLAEIGVARIYRRGEAAIGDADDDRVGELVVVGQEQMVRGEIGEKRIPIEQIDGWKAPQRDF